MIMKKNKDKCVRDVFSVIQKFKDACDDLARLLNETLFKGGRDTWYWIGNEHGGLCDFDDGDFLSPEEMVLILESGMTYEQYAEWRDANVEYSARKGHINLYSWIRGCRHEMFADKIDYSEQ